MRVWESLKVPGPCRVDSGGGELCRLSGFINRTSDIMICFNGEKMIVVKRKSYFCATLSNDPAITITKQCGATQNFLLSINNWFGLELSGLESYQMLFSITWLFIAARRYQALHLLLGTTRWFQLDSFFKLDFSWSISWKLELNSLEISISMFTTILSLYSRQ